VGGFNLAMLRLSVPFPGTKGKYTALSYCWGTSPPYTTTSANLEEHIRGFSLTDLPGTIRDAVKVTRELGLRYLWVDALCIIQGSDEKAARDWSRESSRMEEVYGNAYITIVAAAARRCGDGIFNVRSCVLPIRSDVASSVEGLVTIQKSHYIKEFKDEPINDRAWTLQERLLSTRILTYTTQEMSWQCNKTIFGDNPTNFAPDEIGRSFSAPSWQISISTDFPNLQGSRSGLS
jgi:hypothetical protein